MTSFLCPDHQFKPLSRILSPESVFPVLTQSLSFHHHTLPVYWVCKPESRCDVNLPSPNHCTEEPKFTVCILQLILKRGS
ncbi:hypothetical protein ATANTOWER_004493 [Ataeniobius toweri]|uniref:Uncharacterized protein n=1 Tax=Ataeniobius toweri TaxID=208326 RepID=A0ABU7BXF9_9TELE|nr:hypothetical protein [Ataeniobius toweri]